VEPLVVGGVVTEGALGEEVSKKVKEILNASDVNEMCERLTDFAEYCPPKVSWEIATEADTFFSSFSNVNGGGGTYVTFVELLTASCITSVHVITSSS
jgi:hypothetical protein